MSNHLMASYQQLPVAFEYGAGAWLTDQEGQRYLDALSGIAVCGLGHAHPAVEQAIAEQASQLLHTSNLYRIPLQEQLATRLAALAGMDKVFFCNSGAEANEAAIKISRLYGHKKDVEEAVIIVTEGSFHGRTLATLSATGNAKIQKGFEPLVPGFLRVPYNNTAAIRMAAKSNKNVVAIMLEPILGEGGIVVPDEGYLRSTRTICDELGLLLILDEIQTGMCRTGKWFACQHENVIPDVMTLAKALGNGVPIGACLARGDTAELIQPGSHGSTFGGNQLASRAAISVLDVLIEQQLDMRAEQLGRKMINGFRAMLADVKGVTSIRGKGLMFGIELDRDCAD
ncbi:MAG: aspartate aminotransferase family protein, partial [Gammaproteobacteria bacterium]|nr:aspartate aminotransferase family protein [Gammaproteobacteria bacterium]